jgi:hypothetical protein
MFVFDPNPQFTWPVTARMPANGGFVEHAFQARFRLLPEDRREELSRAGGDLALLQEAVVELVEVEVDGRPFGRTAEEVAAVLRLMPYRTALAEAYVAAVFGMSPGAAARGN